MWLSPMLCTMAAQQKLEQILICQHLSRDPKHTGKLKPKEKSILLIVTSRFHLSWDIVIPHQEDGKRIIHNTRQGAQCPSPGGCQGWQEAVPGRDRVREFPSSTMSGGELKALASPQGLSNYTAWHEKGFWSSHTYNHSPCSSLPFKTINHLLEGI